MNRPLPCKINFFLGILGSFFFFSANALGQTIVPGINRIEMLAVTSGGNIIAAGIAGSGKNADFAVARLKADFTIDPTFGREGIARIDAGGREHLYGLAVRPDGKIIIAGFTQKGKQSDFALTRLTAWGECDAGFGTNGLVITDIGPKDEIHFIVLTGNNSIVAAGFVEENGNADFAVARYRADGTLDPRFGTHGIVITDVGPEDRLYGLAIQRDGKIVAAGSTRNKNHGNDECVVLRFTATGRLDKNFGQGGMAAAGELSRQNVCSSVIVQTDGKIVIAGYVEIPLRSPSPLFPPPSRGRGRGEGADANTDFLIARLLSNGKPDLQFGAKGYQRVDFKNGVEAVHALAIDSNGRLVAAGDGPSSVGISSGFIALARLLPDGALDFRFGHGGKMMIPFDGSRRGEATTMTVTRKGRIVVGGSAGRAGILSSY